jgi:hypothetical protein
MKPLHVVVVAVLLLGIASGGFCQWNEFGINNNLASARWVGMGGAGTAAANDEGALDFNPASLATMNLGLPQDPESAMVWRGSLTLSTGVFDQVNPKLAVVNPQEGWGAAVGYEHASESDWWTDEIAVIGVGYKFKNTPVSLGASYCRDNAADFVHVGLLAEFPQKTLPPIRVGVVAANVTEVYDLSPWLNLGVAVPLLEGLTLAVDVWDVGDTNWRVWNFGAEYQWPEGYAARAGTYDGSESFTGGVGYKQDRWSVDLAYLKWPGYWGSWANRDQWTLTGGYCF